jgi:hypothetical protein
MFSIRWDFPFLGTGNEQGYTNSGIEFFKGKELLENLAREICQNSLDAKNPDLNGPVKVKFELKSIQQSKHALFAEYKSWIDNCKDYWGSRMDDRLAEFIESAEAALAQPEIPVLVASDYNTKGLEGTMASESEESTWRALAHSDGTSVNKGDGSGGSYGIGKNAPFACSSLSMVFYNTYAIDGGRAFQGTSRLATARYLGKRTQGIGHYLNVEEGQDRWLPIRESDDCSFYNEFVRNTIGTDIIIVGFLETNGWVEKMVQAVVSNFFLAIRENKLIVEIGDQAIDSSSIAAIIDEYKDAKLVGTKVIHEWYQALKDPDDGAPLYCTVLEENDVELYLKTDNEYHNQAAYFRSSGMLVRTARPMSFQHFSAVIIIRKEELNKLLRKAEPVRHNRWDYTLISDKSEARKAKDALDQIDTWLRAELMKKYEIIGAKSQDSGEGEYLPDDENSDNNQTGDDILRVRQKISKSQTRTKAPGYVQTGAEPSKGSAIPGDVHGKKKRKKKNKRKKVVAKPGNTPGANPSGAGAPLSAINIAAQKAFVLQEEMGLYKVVIKASEDYPKVKLSFYAVGEDDAEDLLTVQKYTYDGKTKTVSSKSIGPLSFSKEVIKEIFVTFEEKEKMRLNIIASEVK